VASFYTEAKCLKEHPGELWVGWAGGGSHLDSFFDSGAMPALERLTQKRRNVKICIIGPDDIFNALTTRAKVFIPWGTYAEYPAKLACLDIGVAPLYGQYDKRRSWIKGLEYSLVGIPWLGSDYQVKPQPYDFFGKHHLVRNQTRCWETNLLDIVDHYSDYRTQIIDEKDIYLDQDIDRNVEKIIKVYEGTNEAETLTHHTLLQAE
jgi:hypothetical protein